VTQPTKTSPEPEEIARRYQVVQKLGAGAFGTVYKAKDRILGRMVAIKTIRLEGLAASGVGLDELVQRFQQEAQVSAQLRHPNIVTIYDVGEFEGMSYLAMEFIEGTGLDRVVRAEHRLPIERAASIAAQVADALAFAHEHKIVHRDVKPANIMIEAGDRVKVTDFGIAKITNASDSLTATGSLLGTPSYMSPEQARGQSLDGRSDLFAVGSVLYEMVTGVKAFKGESITGLIFKIITEEPQPIGDLDPRVPAAMVQIITKALQKDPAARYQTGREMADALLPLTRPGSTPTVRVAETPTARGMTPVMATPGPAAVDVTRATAPPPVASPPPPPTMARPQPRPVRAAPPPAPRPNYGLWLGIAFAAMVMLAVAAAAAFWAIRRFSPPAGSATTDSTSASIEGVKPPTPPPSVEPSGPGGSPESGTPAGLPGTDTTVAATQPERAAQAPSSTATAPRAAGPRPQAQQPPQPSSEYTFLDEEPEAEADGAEAGRRLAESYRSGGSSSGSSYGASGRFNRRPLSPRGITSRERPAVAVLRHLINAEEAFHKKNERYGELEELRRAGVLFLDVPSSGGTFTRRDYRFELTAEDDGFRALATPLSPEGRPFVGDDSGYIRAGLD
jgi:eukaryotic-like serine/threonine-protein kinase